MSKIFCHYEVYEDYDPRLEEISSFVTNYFEELITDNSVVYILDPYLDPCDSLYKGIMEKQYDNKLYIKILRNLLEINENLTFKIITDIELKRLIDVMEKNESVNSGHASFSLLPEKGKIEVIKYPSKKNKFPDKIHDRWFILRNDDVFEGLHLGPSLDNFEDKDLTITNFNAASAKEAGERFEHIWAVLSTRNLR